jgi:D-arabinose 1-dehydrogenase-like Zn-dependent alcohol dehydrogenase
VKSLYSRIPLLEYRTSILIAKNQTFVDFTKSKDLVADVKAATPGGLGAHAVILLAVSEKPFQQASEYVRSRGTIVAIGLPPDAYLKAPVINTVVRMITIKGSYVGNQQDGVEALDFFARGLIKAPFKLAPLEDLPKIYELMGLSHSLTSILASQLTSNRTRQDCRSLRARDARVISD